MSKNKYNYEITDIDALAAYAKEAVIITKKPVRSKITALIDCGVKEIPGVKLLPATEGAPDER